MRAIGVVFALVLFIAGPAAAQDWAEYQNNKEGFTIAFPGPPKVTETTWTAEHDYVLPAHVYSAEHGRERYSVTVVDYAPLERLGIERAKKCPAGAEPCLGSDLAGPAYWKHVIRGAVIWATFKYFQRDGKVTSYMWNHQDLVEGHQIQMTNNADESRTFAFVAMRENKLFIIEGTVPKGYPPPALFQNSAGWVDKDGNAIRYQTIYANEIFGLGDYPTPGHGGAAGAGGARGAGGRGGAGRGRGAGAPAGGADAPAGVGR
jgi:hypothetical protein